MNAPEPDPLSRDDRLNQVLLAYLEDAQNGQRPDRERLVEQHAEFATELREFFAGRDQLDRIVAPLHEAATTLLQRAPADAALEQRGMLEDTIIIFSSDNGGPLGSGATNGPLRAGKATLYEGGVRVSAFANFPAQITPGTVVRTAHGSREVGIWLTSACERTVDVPVFR